MYHTQLALQSSSQQELKSSDNRWQVVTNDNKLAHPEFQEYIEGEQQWLEEQAYQHDRYLYADRL
jgi:hypothetical protein